MRRVFKIFNIFLFLCVFYTKSFAINDISVLDYALTTSIKNKDPIDRLDSFPNTVKRMYLWTKIKALDPPTYIYHVWYYKGREMAKIRLYIKYPIFRTWSFKTLIPQWTGEWKVVVEDANGNPVFEKTFQVYKER